MWQLPPQPQKTARSHCSRCSCTIGKMARPTCLAPAALAWYVSSVEQLHSSLLADYMWFVLVVTWVSHAILCGIGCRSLDPE